jgi:prepilin-type N-terminal cleavage/methylation domain-containing protein
MARHKPDTRQTGFSLIELMIAMTVTLVITGAVFQLVSAGQTAFRKEPELSARQQNIRVAIDVISRDVFSAGFGLPEFAQVFTENLDGVGATGPAGDATDELELFAASDCPPARVCEVNGAQLTTLEPLSSCYALPSLVILANATEWHPFYAELPGNGANSSCPLGSGSGPPAGGGGDPGGGTPGGGDPGGGNPGGDPPPADDGGGRGRGRRTGDFGQTAADVVHATQGPERPAVTHAIQTPSVSRLVTRTANSNGNGNAGSGNGHVTFPPGHSDFNNPGGPNQVFNNPPEWMLVGQVVRYRVRADDQGVPNLERSAFGGNNLPDGSSSWEIVARGVEDLQVEYLNGTGWHDGPGTVSCGASCGAPGQPEYDTIVRRVKIRLSARADAPNLQGQTTSAVGDAVRGQLETEVAPRAAVVSLGMFAGDY